MIGEVCVPSPDPNDSTTLMTTSGASMAPSPSDKSETESPGHQGGTTGGVDENLRVLYCTNVNISLDYQGIYEFMKHFGIVERIKLKLSADRNSFVCYVTFRTAIAANKACKKVNGHSLNDSIIRSKLVTFKKMDNEIFDFVPKNQDHSVDSSVLREPPSLIWHVATYKDGRENFIKASESIRNKVGNVPQENIKRYGKNILIKAGNATQAALLTKFNVPENGNIKSISPHKSFNTTRGVVYSRDLYEFSEEEILSRCPSFVYKIKKLRGNNAILLTFSTDYVPDYVIISHIRMKVRKYRPSPMQCHNCFVYGHTLANCSSPKKCYVCSGEHDDWESVCSLPKHCFHCKSSHSPNSKDCSRFKLEQSIVEAANDQHISIGSAKRLIMGANKDANSTYSLAMKQLKTSKENASSTSGKSSRPTSVASIPAKSNNSILSASNQSVLPPEVSDSCNANIPEVIIKPSRIPISVSNNSTPLSKVTDSDTPPELLEPRGDDNSVVAMCTPSTKHSSDLPSSRNLSEDCDNSNCVELSSSTVTITKGNDDVDFITPEGKKRARPASPKSDSSGIETSNSFSPLEEAPVLKKQAVSKKATKAEPAIKLTSNRDDQSYRPKSLKSKTADEQANHSSKSKNVQRGSLNPSIPKVDKSGPRKSMLSKENLIQTPTDKSSHSKNGKKL